MKRGLPIRVKVAPGSTFTRFTGFVNTITQTISGSWSQVTVTCDDVLARVRARRPMRALVAEQALVLGASGYWPLSDGSGAPTAQDITGNSRAATLVRGKNSPTSAAYTFDGPAGSGALAGAPDTTLGLTAHPDGAGDNDGGYLLQLGQTIADGEWSVAVWMRSTDRTARATRLFAQTSTTGAPQIEFQVSGATGYVGAFFTTNNSNVTSSPLDLFDGLWHLLVGTNGAVNGQAFYIDGVQVDALGSPATLTGTPALAQVGGMKGTIDPTGGYFFFLGSVAQVGAWATELTASDVETLYDAGAGFNGQTTTTAGQAVAAYLGLEEDLATEADDHEVGPLVTNGANGFDVLALLGATADRPIYADVDGVLRWAHSPHDTDAVIAISADDLYGELAVTHDSQLQFNQVDVSWAGGQELYADSTAIDDNGVMAASLSSAANSAARAYELATWTAATHKDPTTRYTELAVNVLGGTGGLADEFPSTFPDYFGVSDATLATLMGLTINSVAAVTGLSSLAPSTSYTGYVQGCTESISPREWVMAYNTSPLLLYPDVGLVGTGTSDSTLIDDALVGY
jgi:hypothetical protein